MAHAGHPLVGDDVYGLQVGVLGVHVCGSVCMRKAVVLYACVLSVPYRHQAALHCSAMTVIVYYGRQQGIGSARRQASLKGPGSGSALQCVS
jgi:hypothetical protein